VEVHRTAVAAGQADRTVGVEGHRTAAGALRTLARRPEYGYRRLYLAIKKLIINFQKSITALCQKKNIIFLALAKLSFFSHLVWSANFFL